MIGSLIMSANESSDRYGMICGTRQSWRERRPCAVRQPCKVEFRAWVDAFAEERIEHGRRCRAIEAPIVIAQTNLDWICHRPHPPSFHPRAPHTSKAIKDVREP